MLLNMTTATSPRLHHLVRHLAERTELWMPHVRFAAASRWSVRVAATDEFEAWLLTWLPGQSTGLHDHGGSAGAFTVLRGVLEESTMPPAWQRGPAALVHRALPVGRVRAFGADLVHDVANPALPGSGEPAVSLHVYAPALETMRRFVLDDDGHVQVVSLERAGRDW
jgi:predicted metal-dependent enzyme (double-stranded beta helix superfamily)